MSRSQLRLRDRNRAPSDRTGITVVTGPRVTGTAANGQTLTAAATVSVGAPAITEARQWFRINPATGALTQIAGATGATYVLTAPDVGSRISVRSTLTQARSPNRVVWAAPTAVVT